METEETTSQEQNSSFGAEGEKQEEATKPRPGALTAMMVVVLIAAGIELLSSPSGITEAFSDPKEEIKGMIDPFGMMRSPQGQQVLKETEGLMTEFLDVMSIIHPFQSVVGILSILTALVLVTGAILVLIRNAIGRRLVFGGAISILVLCPAKVGLSVYAMHLMKNFIASVSGLGGPLTNVVANAGFALQSVFAIALGGLDFVFFTILLFYIRSKQVGEYLAK